MVIKIIFVLFFGYTQEFKNQGDLKNNTQYTGDFQLMAFISQSRSTHQILPLIKRKSLARILGKLLQHQIITTNKIPDTIKLSSSNSFIVVDPNQQ